MSDPAAGTPTGDKLQFDHAEQAVPGGVTCAFCKQPLLASYYEMNGKLACQRCRGEILAR